MTYELEPLAPQVFGAARDRSYPAPVEMLHASMFHTGPGFDELIDFYRVVLNMRMTFKFTYPSFEFVAMTADDENHRLGFVNVLDPAKNPGGVDEDLPPYPIEDGIEPRHTPLRRCRIEHTSWRYQDFESVMLAARHIHQALGIWPRTARHDGHDLTIDYNDPDGNRVELLSQTASKAEILFRIYQRSLNQGEKRSYSDSYVSFDMEKMIGLFDSGVPVTQLQDREYCKALKAEGKL